MSMSQEEIEALMSGLDIEEDKSDSSISDDAVKVNTQEIEELLSQTEDYKNENEEEKFNIQEEPVEVKVEEFKNIVEEKTESFVRTDEIEQLLNEIESGNLDKSTNLDVEDFTKDIDLSDVLEKEVKAEPKIEFDFKNDSRSEDDIVKDWTSSRINEGIFPLPAEKDTKVVNQLSQVANDSEEKVSQIFDVLSATLDNNMEFRNQIKGIEAFILTQSKLLESLNKKFPNINVFDEHLTSANEIVESINSLKKLANDEDNQIFQAMELMQFNDINRQKIERVMSVIRKLSLYLNNLFEDDGSTQDVAVAKHIHGDENNDLIGDDLDKLIEEFSKQ